MQPSSDTYDFFRRHSRPQPPTIPGQGPNVKDSQPLLSRPQLLPVKRTPSWLPSEKQGRGSDERRKGAKSPVVSRKWSDFRPRYKLIQGNSEYMISASRDSDTLVMFKRACMPERLPARHPNVLLAQCTIDEKGTFYLGFEDARCTLEEILTVTAPLDESQIQIVARSVR